MTEPATSENTPKGSVPAASGPWRPPPPPTRRPRWPWVALVVALVTMMAIGAAFVALPYYVIAPGSARDVDGLVQVDGVATYPPKGSLLFTTVSVGQVRNVYEAVGGWLDPAADVVPERDLLGPGTGPRQYQQQNAQEMTNSKETAEYVAFRRLGYDVAIHGRGAQIAEVIQGSPADGRLWPGEVVVAADARPVRLSADLVAFIRQQRPGQPVHLQVLAPGGAGSRGEGREVVLTPAQKDGTAILGVKVQTYQQRFDIPFRVRIDSGQVGGPSGGLAFTLALLDVLTPGELTGGARVAATGAIDTEGAVGPVGGVAQKTVAVQRAGATLFIVPGGEYAEAKARAGGNLRVEKADSIDEALRVLATLPGSNALSLARPPSRV